MSNWLISQYAYYIQFKKAIIFSLRKQFKKDDMKLVVALMGNIQGYREGLYTWGKHLTLT